MQITIQEKENGNLCLFDTRSGEFLDGCCVKSKDSDMLGIANSIVRKSSRSILELADNYTYQEGEGWAPAIFAKAYLSKNMDIRQKFKERLALKEDKKTQTKRKPKAEKPVKELKVKKEKVAKVPKPPKEKTVIGLNEDGTPIHKGRGRPKSLVPKPEKVVVLDANGNPRRRGRPPKAS